MKLNRHQPELLGVVDKKLVFLFGLIVGLGLIMHFIGPPDSLDTKLYYSGDQARELLKGFTQTDLKAYALNEILDLFFIVIYTNFFMIILRRIYPEKLWISKLPLIGGAADLIETTAVIAVLKLSGSSSWFDWLGVFTFLKWISALIVVILIFIGLMRLIKQGDRF